MYTRQWRRISVRRRRGTEVWWRGLVPSSEKQSFFCHQNDKFWCISMQFLSAKTRTVTRSFGRRIFTFNHETKLIKTVQKLSKNSRSDQRWSDRTIAPSPHSPPALNTPLTPGKHSVQLQNSTVLTRCTVLIIVLYE